MERERQGGVAQNTKWTEARKWTKSTFLRKQEYNIYHRGKEKILEREAQDVYSMGVVLGSFLSDWPCDDLVKRGWDEISKRSYNYMKDLIGGQIGSCGHLPNRYILEQILENISFLSTNNDLTHIKRIPCPKNLIRRHLILNIDGF